MIISNDDEIVKYRNVAGIYRFRNKVNNKSYVGQSVKIGKRIREHLCALQNTGRQYAIHKAIVKYGIENFEIEILATFEQREDLRKILNLAEQIFISFYDSFENGYNETAGGDSMTGRKWSDSQREHMRKIMTGRKRDKNYVDPRSKPVYLYNYVTGQYFEESSAKRAVENIDNSLSIKQIEACVTGKHMTTKNFICAYSKEELENKIFLFKSRNNAN